MSAVQLAAHRADKLVEQWRSKLENRDFLETFPSSWVDFFPFKDAPFHPLQLSILKRGGRCIGFRTAAIWTPASGAPPGRPARGLGRWSPARARAHSGHGLPLLTRAATTLYKRRFKLDLGSKWMYWLLSNQEGSVFWSKQLEREGIPRREIYFSSLKKVFTWQAFQFHIDINN